MLNATTKLTNDPKTLMTKAAAIKYYWNVNNLDIFLDLHIFKMHQCMHAQKSKWRGVVAKQTNLNLCIKVKEYYFNTVLQKTVLAAIISVLYTVFRRTRLTNCGFYAICNIEPANELLFNFTSIYVSFMKFQQLVG